MVPTFIISLRRATNRRRVVADAFDALGLEFAFVEAVDGRHLTHHQRQQYSHWRSLYAMGRPMGAGMLGASLSHLSVYEQMDREAIPVAAVFEDDVEPGVDLPAVLNALDRLPDDWQVVTLHSLFSTSLPQRWDDRPIVPGHQVCTYARVPFGAQGYLITLAGARRALKVAYPVAFPPDELLFRRRPAGLRVYGIEPSVLRHRDIDSEIHALPAPVDPAPPWRRPVDRVVIAAGKADHRVRELFARIRTRGPRTRS